MENKLKGLYREISEIVDDMIPEEWNQFYFYAQVAEDGGRTYFFYEPEEAIGKFQYSLDIEDKFYIDENEFSENETKLYNIARKMREIFKEEDQELWYSFTFMLNAEGKMKIHFDYTDWYSNNYGFGEQLKIWEYKYLGVEPEGEESKALIKKYLEEYPDNPI